MFTRTLLVALMVASALQPVALAQAPAEPNPLGLRNVVPPLDLSPGDLAGMGLRKFGPERSLPLPDVPVLEHVRGAVPPVPAGEVTRLRIDNDGSLRAETGAGSYVLGSDGDWAPAEPEQVPVPKSIDSLNAVVELGDETWLATDRGLYKGPSPLTSDAVLTRHEEYGSNGPADTRVTALAADVKGNLWVGTPRGLSVRRPDGSWLPITGRQGLPYEDITALAAAGEALWIGTSRGAILHLPEREGRRWYYRQGRRYLPGDHVRSIAVGPNGVAYFATDGGLGRIDTVTRTLYEKAEIIEKLLNERHRRMGLVAATVSDNAENPTSWSIPDNDNDGLWTAYHVAAISLAYAATGEERYRQSARESMHALVMLQNASGTPGLVARSVLPPEEGQQRNASARGRRGQAAFQQWQPTPDGKLYWKSDTSSDEIDGHYLALYAYYQHVAQSDPDEKALIQKQTRDLTNYIVDNNYQLIDWTGRRTRWGFWNPENLNDDPSHYLESGLNSLQILSFLQTAYFITGDAKFRDHYRKLIMEHGYLNNVLLEKKVFPDETNHSDDQLGFVAWYPILQLEHTPEIRVALHKAVRRHYVVELPESASFFILPYGTIDPDYTDFEAAIRNLRQIPTDRRQWRQENSHRADIVFDTRIDRFQKRQMIHVLPADQWCFGKWNRNPYVPDEGGDGREEDDGAAYLLPYWMARYHGFLAAPDPANAAPAELP